MTPPEPISRGPKFLVDWLNSVLAYVVSTRPVAGINVSIREETNGCIISSRKGSDGGGGGSEFWHPFRLDVRQKPGTQDWEFKCSYGLLFKSPDGDFVTSSGAVEDTDTWFPLTGATRVWLEVEFDEDVLPISAKIMHGENFPESGKAAKYTGTAPNEKQTHGYKHIGSIKMKEEAYVPENLVFNYLILSSRCLNNKPLIYAVPY